MRQAITARVRWLALGLLLAVLVLWIAWDWQHGYQLRSIDYIAGGIGLGAYGLVALWIARRSGSPNLRSGAIGAVAGVCSTLLGIAVFAVHRIY